MKRYAQILSALMLSLTTISGFSQITKQQAIDFVMDSIVGVQVDSVNVYMEASVQTGSYYTLSQYDSIAAPFSDYWLFFIDLKPEYAWSHDCQYIFIDHLNGIHFTESSQIPPFQFKSFMEEVSTPIQPLLTCPNFTIQNTNILPPANPNLYALMFTGGDDTPGSCAFWNALSHMYGGLREHGFAKENIKVLSASGVADGIYNPSLDLDNDNVNEILNFSCSTDHLENVIDQLSGSLGPGSMLYVFVTTHGFRDLTDNSSSFILYGGEHLTDHAFAQMLTPINCSQMIFVICTCHAGGFTDDLLDMSNSARKTILTSSSWWEPYWRDGLFKSKSGIDKFNYLVGTAFRGGHPDVIDPLNRAPWNVTFPIGSLPISQFQYLFPGMTEVNFDLPENGGNGNEIQEIQESINYTQNYDGLFNSTLVN